jgi:6-phosphogluconolactonase
VRDVADLVVVASPEEAATRVAEMLVDAARSGSQIALAGGSTPRRAYELAASLEPDWRAAGIWWGDERCVPPGDERSNFRMAQDALLDRVAHAPQQVHRIEGELDPDVAAARYDNELRGATLDLVLLGIGPDGHTASLFPNAPSLEERGRLAVAVAPGLEPRVTRVTLTIPALAAAREIVFLVAGPDKANAVARAFAGEPDPATPSSLVRSTIGRTVVVVDEAAAARLR